MIKTSNDYFKPTCRWDITGKNNMATYKTTFQCAKCGAIKRKTSLKGLQCGHDEVYYNTVIKVKDKNGNTKLIKLEDCK